MTSYYKDIRLESNLIFRVALDKTHGASNAASTPIQDCILKKSGATLR